MPPSILIVGLGVAGPTLASFLLLDPRPVEELPHITILERSPSPRALGQNVDVRGTGAEILRKLGLETAVRSNTTREEGVHFVDKNNAVWVVNPADKTGNTQTGTSDIEILRGELAQLCYRRSQTISDEVKSKGGHGVEYLFGDHLSSIEQDGERVSVRFANSGAERSFDLLVGADGLQSATRRQVWGEADDHQRIRNLHMYGGFFSMPATANDSLWRRWFHAPGRKSIMTRPSGDPSKTTVFMYVINPDDPRLLEAAHQGRKGLQLQRGLLHEYFDGVGWESDRILREADAADDFYYSMIAQVKMDRWSKGRVVLLGDAGYCASPISGMGTTLALNGAYNLAGAISQHPNDFGSAFAQYEAKMRPLTEKAQALPLDGKLHSLMNPESAWGIWVLHVVLGALFGSGLTTLMARLAGPPANAVKVDDYGFKELQDSENYHIK